MKGSDPDWIIERTVGINLMRKAGEEERKDENQFQKMLQEVLSCERVEEQIQVGAHRSADDEANAMECDH